MKLMFTSQNPSTLAAACVPSTVRQTERVHATSLPVASLLAARVRPQHSEWVQVPTIAPFGALGQGTTLSTEAQAKGGVQYLTNDSTAMKLNGISGVPPRGRPV